MENRCTATPQPPASDYVIGAHYFPGWKPGTHWGWQKVQPFPERKPLLGWYDESDPDVTDWELKWAIEHGIQYFVYCWYRDRDKMGQPMDDSGHRLGHAIHEGLFRSRFGSSFRFAIMWETHNAGVATDERDLLCNLLPYWIDTYFSRPNYMRLNGRPMLFVYTQFCLETLGAPFGGVEQLPRVLDLMRSEAAKRGLPGLTIGLEYRGTDAAVLRRISELGFEWTFAYCWHTPQKRPTAREAIAHQLACLQAWKAADALPFLPTVSMGWDPMPWQNDNPRTPWLHADKMTRWKLSPPEWERLLRDVKRFMDALPADSPGRRMLLLDNWNEWGEGHYISPQVTDGFGYLRAVREVFTRCDNQPDERPPGEAACCA
jgi:hypothetical protein